MRSFSSPSSRLSFSFRASSPSEPSIALHSDSKNETSCHLEFRVAGEECAATFSVIVRFRGPYPQISPHFPDSRALPARPPKHCEFRSSNHSAVFHPHSSFLISAPVLALQLQPCRPKPTSGCAESYCVVPLRTTSVRSRERSPIRCGRAGVSAPGSAALPSRSSLSFFSVRVTSCLVTRPPSPIRRLRRDARR